MTPHSQDLLWWEDWMCYLAVALDMQESDQYVSACYAGADPKTWVWSHYDIAKRHGGTRWKSSAYTAPKQRGKEIESEMARMFGVKDIDKQRQPDKQEEAWNILIALGIAQPTNQEQPQ